MGVGTHRNHRIAKNSEVGPRTLSFDRVGGVRVAKIEMGHQCRGEVASGRGAYHADALWIDLPLRRVGADESYRASGVFEHPRMPITVRAEPILDDKRSDAV